MKGKILIYSPDVMAGLIKAEDGEKYPFDVKQWLSNQKPTSNMIVRFKTEPDCAVEVCPENEIAGSLH